MPIVDCIQRSPEWLAMRVGAVTASRVGDVMAKLKAVKDTDGHYKPNPKEAADRANYRRELVAERLTGLSADHYNSPYMKDGMENEPLARAAYEMQTDLDVNPNVYAIHDSIEWFGASPDSLVGKDGLLEIKCLKSENHLDILLSGTIPDEYHPQLLAELACSGRQWVDFVSFDPRMPERKQLFIKRFNRDATRIAEMEAEVVRFLAEVDAMVARLLQDDPSSLEAPLKASLAVVR